MHVRHAGLIAVSVAFMGCASSDPADGYVLKRGEGEALYDGQTLIKASPASGSQGSELFWALLAQDFSTGIHVHHVADEFFYVVSGNGMALVGGTEVPIETGDVVFVPRGQDHRLRTVGEDPLEIVFLVDRSGLADEFRDGHRVSEAGAVALTLEQLNAISEQYGTTYKTLR